MLAPAPSIPLRAVSVHWEMMGPGHVPTPDRYLGERSELPLSAEPGEWCDVVIHHSEGELRFRLVAVDDRTATAQLRYGGPSLP